MVASQPEKQPPGVSKLSSWAGWRRGSQVLTQLSWRRISYGGVLLFVLVIWGLSHWRIPPPLEIPEAYCLLGDL